MKDAKVKLKSIDKGSVSLSSLLTSAPGSMAVLEVRLVKGVSALLTLGLSVQVFDLVAEELLDFFNSDL